MASTKVTKAVFPIAGLGTRFQPFAHGGGKEFVPVVESGLAKPIIHLAIEEAAQAGIRQFIFVVSPARKTALENYLAPPARLLEALEAKGATAELASLKFLANLATEVVEQPHPLGLGDAVLQAKPLVGDEPFAVLLADDILTPPLLPQMVAHYQKGVMVAVQQVDPSQISAYGVVTPKGDSATSAKAVPKASGKASSKDSGANSTFAFGDIIEKPKPSQAPSDFGIVGRYILSPAMFKALEEIGTDERSQMTDAINLVEQTEPAIAFAINNHIRFDCGTPSGWLKMLKQQMGKKES